ncbi:hypothetical protein PIB30_066350 [Stylosanthes scabra]|uniref:Uncharacterized protein n=1 Tax=Stylosanthes scabra TaxID=79078 RepID=A0ABU6UL24_9FABA|nr:hypothetical protein [Stylosanthes scabra]
MRDEVSPLQAFHYDNLRPIGTTSQLHSLLRTFMSGEVDKYNLDKNRYVASVFSVDPGLTVRWWHYWGDDNNRSRALSSAVGEEGSVAMEAAEVRVIVRTHARDWGSKC